MNFYYLKNKFFYFYIIFICFIEIGAYKGQPKNVALWPLEIQEHSKSLI
jgi:hypothetical protein